MSRICIVTALPAESRVFIDALKLRHVEARGLRLYAHEGYLLVQTGVGKLKAAAATAAVLQTYPDIAGMINTGVAGGDAEIGLAHIAHQFVDVSTGMQWFPHMPAMRILDNLPSATIRTVDAPSEDYQTGSLLDMEAAGIMSAATQYLSTHQIHSIKVVSDNPSTHLSTVTSESVQSLMHESLPAVRKLADWLMHDTAANALQQPLDDCCKTIQSHVHHTVTEQHRLRRLLQQHFALTGELPETGPLVQLGSARRVNTALQSSVQQAPLIYEG